MNVQCELCPKMCLLKPGQAGDCRIRVNLDGELHATTYGFPCAIHVDPVEKKPMYHFFPGSQAFSLATVGCNLHCKNCQNWEISQQSPENVVANEVMPDDVVKYAMKYDCASIAYTYTDPVVFYEYTFDTSIAAHKKGIKNILVSAGYINHKPFKELCKHLDGANIDLKAFSDQFYRQVCSATLKPVLDTLVTAKNAGVIVEVTNLVIPTLNDSDKDLNALCRWIKENMGQDTPLHFSRFSPRYRMRNLPSTPKKTLERARAIALSYGLEFVYIGNILVKNSSTTFCPKCKKILIQRRGFTILENNLQHGKCPSCKQEVYGLWT